MITILYTEHRKNIQVVAEHLSVEEVAGIKDSFNMMDINNRGKINLEELKNGLQKLGQHIPDADLQILMEAVSIIIWPTKHFFPLSSTSFE